MMITALHEEFKMGGRPSRDQSMTRRNFLKAIAATGAAASVGAPGLAAEAKTGDMIYRALGRTEEKVSAIRMEDPDRIFEENGAQQAMLEAKKASKIRYIGFTGHKDPLVHLRALEVAAQHQFKFDAVQMPLNVMDAHFRSFGKQVVPVLVK